MKTETVHFAGDRQAKLYHVSRLTPAAEIVARLSSAKPRALICLNGGTAELNKELASCLETMIVEGLAPIASNESVTVITGGTDAGIFSMFGRGVERLAHPVSLIGVAPERLVKWPGGGAGDTALEPHHTSFVLVDGEEWGDETKMMYSLADEWSRTCPSIAVFAGGGKVTLREMQENVAQSRQMILLAGSGRSTDAVLAARQNESPENQPILEIVRKGKIVPFDLQASPQTFTDLINEMLFGFQLSDSAHRL